MSPRRSTRSSSAACGSGRAPGAARGVDGARGDRRATHALLELDCREAWHFPAGPGRRLGRLPSGRRRLGDRAAGGDARARRRLSRDAGAPRRGGSTRYPELAEWLGDHCPVVCDDGPCAIFALGPYPAFYGRERDAEVNRQSVSAGLSLERGEVLGTEAHGRGCHVLLEVGDGPGARNREHDRRALQQPGQRDLSRRSRARRGDPSQRLLTRQPPCRQRLQSQKDDPGTFARGEHGSGTEPRGVACTL